MGARPFTSESYARPERPALWRDVLASTGLSPTSPQADYDGFATALQRAAGAVTLTRLAAGAQRFRPLTQAAAAPPLAFLSDEECVVAPQRGPEFALPRGGLVLLPRSRPWSISCPRGVRAAVLTVGPEAAPGRFGAAPKLGEARLAPSGGFADIVARAMEATAHGLETLEEPEWVAAAQALADLFMTLAHRVSVATGAPEGGAQAALVHRIYQNVERRLDDPELSPAEVAAGVGVSERYLQKLLEGAGANFSQHLRERRLQRTHADLMSPLEAQRSISEIAYGAGYNDAAHFSRAFRQRFGQTPRDFRRAALERATARAPLPGQRGWPSQALARSANAPSQNIGEPRAAAARADGRNARRHHLRVDAGNVHWGYFSRSLKPVIEIASGDTVVVETLSQHASDDADLMILGDAGAESVFGWTATAKNVDRRGAGPMDASVFGRGAGEGFGVHICTGPIAVKGAEPGDVLEIRLIDIRPRPSGNPACAGRVFGSSVSAWWGYHYDDLLADAPTREIITIYEIDAAGDCARALYAYRWTPTADPFGVVHATYDYPGVPIRAAPARRRIALEGVTVPLRPHFGVIAVAPRETGPIDSVPPSYFGGNLDNWRLGRGAAVYLPVSAPGALLSIGDPHAAQGDGEVAGTAIECSMTGTLEVVLHKQTDLKGRPFADLTYPLIETPSQWVLTGFSHPNYLAEFGAQAQSEVYANSSLDLAMKDAFRKTRRFLMNVEGLSEDEAIALMSAAVDFGVTQVVDGNWGVHAIVSKRLFEGREKGTRG